MTILGLHHAQITVPRSAETAARAFYVGLLGLAEVAKPAGLAERGGFWLQVGDREVHVSLEDGVDRSATKAHLAYEVRDLDHWQRRLTDAGLTLERQPPIPGYRRFLFRDPFGNRVEMLEREAVGKGADSAEQPAAKTVSAAFDQLDDFHTLVDEALATLPEELRAHMSNVEVLIKLWPSPSDLRRARVTPGHTLLGLYSGIPLTQRTGGYNLVPPDTITLFQGPITRQAGRNRERLRELVRRVTIHEIAHHFGISDDRLRELGAY